VSGRKRYEGGGQIRKNKKQRWTRELGNQGNKWERSYMRNTIGK
jgi:hypothetical protein